MASRHPVKGLAAGLHSVALATMVTMPSPEALCKHPLVVQHGSTPLNPSQLSPVSQELPGALGHGRLPRPGRPGEIVQQALLEVSVEQTEVFIRTNIPTGPVA